MATRRSPYRAKNNVSEKPKRRCRECAHSFDWHSKALDGSMILCRCPFKKEGKYCIFLSDYACDNFIERKEE